MLSGSEFRELCRLLERAGFYVRAVDVKGARYHVRDIHKNAEGKRQKAKRCAPEVAQLWFALLEVTA